MATVNIHIGKADGTRTAQGCDRIRAACLGLSSVIELLGGLPPDAQVYADDLSSLLKLLGRELEEGLEVLADR